MHFVFCGKLGIYTFTKSVCAQLKMLKIPSSTDGIDVTTGIQLVDTLCNRQTMVITHLFIKRIILHWIFCGDFLSNSWL